MDGRTLSPEMAVALMFVSEVRRGNDDERHPCYDWDDLSLPAQGLKLLIWEACGVLRGKTLCAGERRLLSWIDHSALRRTAEATFWSCRAMAEDLVDLLEMADRDMALIDLLA